MAKWKICCALLGVVAAGGCFLMWSQSAPQLSSPAKSLNSPLEIGRGGSASGDANGQQGSFHQSAGLKGPSTSAATPETRRQSANLMVGEVAATWKRAATRGKLSASQGEIVSAELMEVLDRIGCHPTSGQVEACELSFDRIIESQYRLRDDEQVQGSARWIAWCAADAFRRSAMSVEEKTRIHDGYIRFGVVLTAKMREHILNQIPEDRRAASAPELDKWFAAWRLNMDKWIRGLQDDFLFPAFREPLSKRAETAVLTRYEKATMYPEWELSPPDPMSTADDWYRAKLESWFKNSLTVVMFMVTIEEVKPRFALNEFWGHCLHSSGGTDTLWPLEVALKSDTAKNAQKGWKRKSTQ